MTRQKRKIVTSSLAIVIVISLIGCQGSATTERIEHDEGKEEEQSAEVHLADEEHFHEEQEGDEITLSPEAMAEVGVEVIDVEAKTMTETRTYPGSVVPRPDGEALVGSLVGGRIQAVHANLGDTVSPGSPLCSVESPEIGHAQANLIKTSSRFQFVQAEVRRHRALLREKIGSQKDILRMEAELQAAEAERAAAERTLLSLGFAPEEISQCTEQHCIPGLLVLRSPIGGTVATRQVRLGQRVEPGDNLFHVVDLSRLWVRVELYEQDMNWVRIGQSAEIGPQAYPGRVTEGHVVADGLLIPNLFVTCRLDGDTVTAGILAVPEESIVQDEHGDWQVFIELEPGHFVPREVETGRSSSGWVEVVHGLSEGERVASRGAFFLKSEAAKSTFGHGHAH